MPRRLWILYASTMICVVIANALIFLRFSDNQQCNCPKCPGEDQQIKYNAIEDICFVSVPRPLKNADQYRRMKLAIASWLACSPSSRVLLYIHRHEFDPTGNFPKELDKEFGEGRIIYAGGIRSDHNGVPYINEWFIAGIRDTPSKYICFINSDILLSEKWLTRVKQVFRVMEGKKPLLIGQRIDFDLDDSLYKLLRFDQEHLLSDIDQMVRDSKHSDHSPFGIDFFAFRADEVPFDVDMMPPFIMGRYNWDNWLIGWFNKICDTVTFKLDPPIYHMNHVRHRFDVSDPRVAINHHLKKANRDFFGSNFDANWKVKKGVLVHKKGSEKYALEDLTE